MNDLATQKFVILMKNDLALFVEESTGQKIAAHLVGQEAHSFIKIHELGQTINSAEIEAVYTPDMYAELLRIQAGEFKCLYGTWHKKKQECECLAERKRKEREDRIKEQEAEDNKPMTEAERAEQREYFLKKDETCALDRPDSLWGAMYKIGNKRGRIIRKATLREWKKAHPGAKVSNTLAIEV